MRDEGSELVFLEAAITGDISEAIENQEKRGQGHLVYGSSLPIRGSEHECWAKFGVVFGDPGEDRLFRPCTLPEGWTKRPTDHSMWTDLLDERGRVRAKIFYKAAFYDRDAFMHPEPRFTIRRDYEREDSIRVSVFRVLDAGEEVYRTGEVDHGAMPNEDVQAHELTEEQRMEHRLWHERKRIEMAAIHAECHAWLVEQGYPDHEDVSLYWDEV
jgi:hypothetical protein